MTSELLDALWALTPLAPLHQPRCLAPIRAIKSLQPSLRQIACFDTAFHFGLALPVGRFAMPRRFEDMGIRRYGFHGLSFEYIAARLAARSPESASRRTVVAHLGNGASLCAMRHGKSVDTTTGLTPLDGLVMGTRCGLIDSGVLLNLLQEKKMSVDEVQHLLYEQSSLIGVYGVSADMRLLLASRRLSPAKPSTSSRSASQARLPSWQIRSAGWNAWFSPTGSVSTQARSGKPAATAWPGFGVKLDAFANPQGKM